MLSKTLKQAHCENRSERNKKEFVSLIKGQIAIMKRSNKFTSRDANFYFTTGLSGETLRKWVNGDAIPKEENILLLLAWLNGSRDYREKLIMCYIHYCKMYPSDTFWRIADNFDSYDDIRETVTKEYNIAD